MKVGDKLYCYNNSFEHYLKVYNSIYIITNITHHSIQVNEKLWFTILPDCNGESYKKWFMSKSEIRRLKIKQLELNI